MFKKTISTLVVPISFGMLLLILLLGYLVNDAATLKESSFRDTVNEVMADLSDRIETYEQLAKVKRRVGLNNWYSQLMNMGLEDAETEVIIKDSVFVKDGKEITMKVVEKRSKNGTYMSSTIMPSETEFNQFMESPMNNWAAEVLSSQGNLPSAMNNLFELCPDARRIIRCAPKPMFED